MIGIFDSGIGGLTVTRAILRQLPEYQLMYLGDTARVPYGNRSQDLIYQFTQEALTYLFEQGCVLVIVACNTASAEALRKIQQEWLPQQYPDRKVLGVIRPVAEVAVEQSTGSIGVVGTRGTVSSHAYKREIEHLSSNSQVFEQACPLLVPLVEEGWINKPETRRIIRGYLRPLKKHAIDILILGCTHYPMLAKTFTSILGKRVTVLDTAAIVAEKLQNYLQRHPEIESRLTQSTDHIFVFTDVTDTLEQRVSEWLGMSVAVQKVELE